ncbi:hypothetical protein [Bacteroides uniformis]|uniref:hypothetical protein n=1 Tax=Bacteroides uniformis TaxID=820 RepID=UPI0021643954|nr:hypothetical protein [Bacteroides uniformis]UVS16698.1 hypothetical protein NXX72_15590 [Bacteroides uniformis]
MSTDYSKKTHSSCNASAGCTFMAREAGYQIPAITINAINIQTIETHTLDLHPRITDKIEKINL